MLRLFALCLSVSLVEAPEIALADANDTGAVQPVPPPPQVAPMPVPATTPTPAIVGLAPASASVVTPTAPSDHDQLAGHLAVGYFGTSLLPIGIPPATAGLPPTGGTVTAPSIGVRYWLSRRLGIDAAVGFGYSSGSESINSASGASPTTFGFDVHAGLPIAAVSSSHYVFELVPETLFGYTTGSIAAPAGVGSQTVSGLLFNIGGRVGTEIHFGFIGVPQLSLQASIGLYFTHSSYAWSQGANSASVQTNSIATSVTGAPWAIFVNNISALYYF